MTHNAFPPAPIQATVKDLRMAEAAASLAPHKTRPGYRPDWQTARDDEVEAVHGRES